MKRWLTLLALVFGLSGDAVAADLPLNAFFGSFAGTGVARSEDSQYFGVTVRDFDVQIEKTDSGFSVTWTTVLRQGGDPANPSVRRRSATLTFTPTGKPNVYRARESDPMSDGGYAWARLYKNTLGVYIVSIDANGVYELQRYQRTLSGGGMDIVFTRLRDGEVQRTVKGKLAKQGK